MTLVDLVSNHNFQPKHIIRLSFPYFPELALSMKSAEVIVAAAFQQVRLKDVSRSQLSGAVKSLCPEKKKQLRAADKSSMVLPVAKALLNKGIVQAEGDMENLSPRLKRLEHSKSNENMPFIASSTISVTNKLYNFI